MQKFIRGFGKRAFIVTSKSFVRGGAREGVLDELLSQLMELDVECEIFGEIEPNPRTSTIDRAGELARAFKPRYIIGLGGGSVMDAAKCVALIAVSDNRPSIYEHAHRGTGKPGAPFNHALPIVCIPTVAATGSEADRYAVVTEWEQHRKVTVFGRALQPALSIIDPELTYSVPERQTIDGAIDIITHVMESYLSCTDPSEVQDRFTESIVETVVTSLKTVLEHPKDEQGRSQLSWCSSLALSGILAGRDGGWPIHALEHGLSAWCDVAHGRGLALILPRIMLFDSAVVGDKIVNFNRRVFGTRGSDPAQAMHEGLIQFMKSVGAMTRIDEMGGRDLAEKAVDHALEVSGVLKRSEAPYLENCRPISRSEALNILTMALD